MHFDCGPFNRLAPHHQRYLSATHMNTYDITKIKSHMNTNDMNPSCLCIHQCRRLHCFVNPIVNFFLNYLRCLQPCHCPCVLEPCLYLVEAHFQIHISLYLLVVLWLKQLYYTSKLLSLIEREQYLLNIESYALYGIVGKFLAPYITSKNKQF